MSIKVNKWLKLWRKNSKKLEFLENFPNYSE
ncbi:hypothetical protein HD_0352 [[Haemophilus] ducreyi 35000HP]|uniref:Uncharacterized protein n=1 Tax=Haemophilus ducreyi (strain 35000HP / ATCC 700724) TaxID=233412 RepID=Q7VNX3_HAEDU|nr:hypothetical protein HD_0352 [[Haemophilus] ducreyi 35000HP]